MSRTAEVEARIRLAADDLREWIGKQDYRGWDPHDALLSAPLRALARTHRWMGVALLQAVKRSPLNLRPLLGVGKGVNPKGMGLLLIAATQRWLRTGDVGAAREAAHLARWLEAHRWRGGAGAGWGYHFDWPNRGFVAPAGTPTVVNTAVIGLALQDAAASGVLQAGDCDVDGVELARSACDFVLNDLARFEGPRDEIAFSYTPLDRRYIHNANTWAAWLLAACARRGGEQELRSAALEAARFTARRQQEDGSWRYGIGPRDRWIDNFHTGFVLDALRGVGSLLNTSEFDDAIARGYTFWRTRMFDPDGAPRYYVERRWPVDAHAVAQAALTHLRVAPDAQTALDRAGEILLWGIEHMRDEDGYFHYQLRRRYRVRTPFLRWSQAWMLHGMEAYLLRAQAPDAAVGCVLA